MKRTFQPNNRKRKKTPRLPRPHAHPRRSGGAQGPAPAGPRPPVGLIWRDPRPCDVRRPRPGARAIAQAPVTMRYVPSRRPTRRGWRIAVGRAAGQRRGAATACAAGSGRPSPPTEAELAPGGAVPRSARGREAADDAVRRAAATPCGELVRGRSRRSAIVKPPPLRGRGSSCCRSGRGGSSASHLTPRCRFDPSCSQYALEALERARRRPWHLARGPAGGPLPSLGRRRVRPGARAEHTFALTRAG